MVEVKFSLFRKELWFCKPNLINSILLVNYKQVKSRSFLYKSSIFYTLLIDLKQTEQEIRRGFKSNYRNEINRAIALKLSVEAEDNIPLFVDFYNRFAKEKKLDIISKNMKPYLSYLEVTKIIFENRVLVMHSYIMDKERKRVRLLHSATDLNGDMKIVGYANKLLHLQDMLLFKSRGYELYDFGGINPLSKDKKVNGIDRYKKGFGGEESIEYNSQSYMLYYLKKLKRLYD